MEVGDDRGGRIPLVLGVRPAVELKEREREEGEGSGGAGDECWVVNLADEAVIEDHTCEHFAALLRGAFGAYVFGNSMAFGALQVSPQFLLEKSKDGTWER